MCFCVNLEVVLEDDTAAVVKFSDRIVEPEDIFTYSQQFHGFIREFGERYTTMVLSVPKARVECKMNFFLFSMVHF